MVLAICQKYLKHFLPNTKSTLEYFQQGKQQQQKTTIPSVFLHGSVSATFNQCVFIEGTYHPRYRVNVSSPVKSKGYSPDSDFRTGRPR